MYFFLFFFFFQAEDGIRDGHVTGVQTCALPIYKSPETFEQAISRTKPAAPRRISNGVRTSRYTNSDRNSVVSGKSVNLDRRRSIERKKKREKREGENNDKEKPDRKERVSKWIQK